MSALLILLCACSAALAQEYYVIEEAEIHFERYIVQYNRSYADETEKAMKFEIFKFNLEEINRLNKESKHAVFGITQFMDMTEEEFINTHTGFRYSDDLTDYGCTVMDDNDIPNVDAPESFDWREQNIIGPVKDQQGCGSCFAFSSIGNIESQYAIKHKQMISLSEQQIVDCDTLSNGCGGGSMAGAFTSLIKLGGVDSETGYPYIGRENGGCLYNPNQALAKVVSCNSYSLSSQESLKKLLYSNGPISIAVKASGFNKYHGGILHDETCDVGGVNHAVLLVGYGTEDDIPYWLIKNSWGTSFGENGYVKVQRGENAKSCGLMNNAMASAVVQ